MFDLHEINFFTERIALKWCPLTTKRKGIRLFKKNIDTHTLEIQFVRVTYSSNIKNKHTL